MIRIFIGFLKFFNTRPFPEPLMLGRCNFKTLDLRASY